MTTDYLTPILEANGAFFAFSQSQFDEQKKEGVIYVSMGAGLICPKENAENALKRYIEIAPKEFTKVLISETFKECFNEAIEKDLF